jgi:hypothetical protein
MDNSSWYNNPLYLALTGFDSETDLYLENTSTKDIREHFSNLFTAITETDKADLKAFTMAAMQGLSSNPLLADFTNNERAAVSVHEISKTAVEIARATLSELSKHQQG